MSLINQMLRDLEERRKAENQSHPVNQVSLPSASSRSAIRWLCLALLGVALGSLVWFGLKSLPDRSEGAGVTIARSKQSAGTENGSEQKAIPVVLTQPQVQVRPVAQPADKPLVESGAGSQEPPKIKLADASGAAQAEPGVAEKIVARPQIAETSPPAIAPVQKTVPSVSDAPPAKLSVASRGAKNVSLVKLGIVEGIDSIRLMFEFEKLPAYQVHSDGLDATALTVAFLATGKDSRLEIPAFRGPLLKQLKLEPAKQDLQLLLEFGKPVKLQAYSLPADGRYGDRLLLELSEDRAAQRTIYRLSQDTMGAKLRSHKGPVGSNSEDPGQQAEVLNRRALRYLEQGNDGAAKNQFAKALELTPGNVELRLRLVNLLTGQQQQARAEKLLVDGLTLTPENPQLRTYYGHLLLEKNQLADALALLQAKPIPALPDQPDYHALLAALEQENGQFANSATRYRELLQIRPAQADWWLMLAIAYEQLNDVKLARSAYRQALEKTGLTTEHRQFSMERLERLQRLQD